MDSHDCAEDPYNTVYVGELVQGKRGTPNYKVKKMRERKPEDWVVVEHNHEPIIDMLLFSAVQKMMQRDTRTSPDHKTVQVLAGLLFCPDCNRAMCRRVVTRGQKSFTTMYAPPTKRDADAPATAFLRKSWK